MYPIISIVVEKVVVFVIFCGLPTWNRYEQCYIHIYTNLLMLPLSILFSVWYNRCYHIAYLLALSSSHEAALTPARANQILLSVTFRNWILEAKIDGLPDSTRKCHEKSYFDRVWRPAPAGRGTRAQPESNVKQLRNCCAKCKGIL